MTKINLGRAWRVKGRIVQKVRIYEAMWPFSKMVHLHIMQHEVGSSQLQQSTVLNKSFGHILVNKISTGSKFKKILILPWIGESLDKTRYQRPSALRPTLIYAPFVLELQSSSIPSIRLHILDTDPLIERLASGFSMSCLVWSSLANAPRCSALSFSSWQNLQAKWNILTWDSNVP